MPHRCHHFRHAHSQRGQSTIVLSLIVVVAIASTILLLQRGFEGRQRVLDKSVHLQHVQAVMDYGMQVLRDMYVLDARCSPRRLNARLNTSTVKRQSSVDIDGRVYSVQFGVITPTGKTASDLDDTKNWPRRDTDLSNDPEDTYVELRSVINKTMHKRWIFLINTCTPFDHRWLVSPQKTPYAAPSSFFATNAGTRSWSDDLRGSIGTLCESHDPTNNARKAYGFFGALAAIDNRRNYATPSDIPYFQQPISPLDSSWLRIMVDSQKTDAFWPQAPLGPPLCAADMNGDGVINTTDAQLLEKYLLGLLPRVPTHRIADIGLGLLGYDTSNAKNPRFP